MFSKFESINNQKLIKHKIILNYMFNLKKHFLNVYLIVINV